MLNKTHKTPMSSTDKISDVFVGDKISTDEINNTYSMSNADIEQKGVVGEILGELKKEQIGGPLGVSNDKSLVKSIPGIHGDTPNEEQVMYPKQVDSIFNLPKNPEN